jgi:7-cyano-7-deazaguanine synthase
MNKKAIVLISGGLDSATCLAVAQKQNFDCYALTVDYGQRNFAEIKAARAVAKFYRAIEHRIVNVDFLRALGGSALTDDEIDVPDFAGDGEIPVTYVPARNTIFLSLALGWAEIIGAYDIFYGANAVDYSGYPDCRPDYIEAFERVANLATKAGIEGKRFTIHAPLLSLSKAETIALGTALGIDYRLTITCYQPDHEGRACGRCDSCTLRKEGFIKAGIADPTFYV